MLWKEEIQPKKEKLAGKFNFAILNVPTQCFLVFKKKKAGIKKRFVPLLLPYI